MSKLEIGDNIDYITHLGIPRSGVITGILSSQVILIDTNNKLEYIILNRQVTKTKRK